MRDSKAPRRPGRRPRRAATLVLAALLAGPGQIVAQAPEFRVNSYTPGLQLYPAVAGLGDGGFVVVWQSSRSPGADSDRDSILGRRFDASASPLGDDFQVNADTTSKQISPRVESLAGGGFVVVWITEPPPGQGAGLGDIKGRIFDAAGAPVASEFQVDPPDSETLAFRPAVAAADAGGFAVVWHDTDEEVFIRSFDAAGTALGAPVLLDTDPCLKTSGLSTVAGVDYVALWRCTGGATLQTISLRRFGADGLPLAATQVGPETAGALAATPVDDGFLVFVPDASESTGWRGERFDLGGEPTGKTLSMTIPLALAAVDEGFVTVWSDNVPAGTDTDRQSVKFGRVSPGGQVLNPAQQVNVFTTQDQVSADVAALPGGSFVVVWRSSFSADDDELASIRGRVLGDDVFADGFERGDTSAWDAEAP
ncbi:MAG: hypothetical protein AAFX50_01960 [Acidobacteriota bacterium]